MDDDTKTVDIETSWRASAAALIASGALFELTRAQWRRFCQFDERQSFRDVLVKIADEYGFGSEEIRVGLLKAAHAMCPLHDYPALELSRALIHQGTVALEWSDVILTALTEQQTFGSAFTGEALRALGATVELPVKSAADRIRRRTIFGTVGYLGLSPGWLKSEEPSETLES